MKNTFKVAAAAYPLSQFNDWADFEKKLHGWVGRACGMGADLLVFPEYGAMELATLESAEAAADLEGSIVAVSRRMEAANALYAQLAEAYGVHILGASGPVMGARGRPVNRAYLFSPDGILGYQDKQIMTRFEAEIWDIVPGDPLRVFETELGPLGILICYDSEFPLLGRALSEADLLLVPSVTETLAGYTRVCLGARARAMEHQCFSVMSSVVGSAHWTEAIGSTAGAGGAFCPPDFGMPATGILAQGELNRAGWTYATLDREQLARLRTDGTVLNRRDWDAQQSRLDLLKDPSQ